MPKEVTPRRLPRWFRSLQKGRTPPLSDLPAWEYRSESRRRNPRERCYVCSAPAKDFQKRWFEVGGSRQHQPVCDDHRNLGDEV